MSLFGSLMGDFEDDPIFGSHMRSMRHMNNMMNSLFSDPFGMMGGPPALTGPPVHHRAPQRHNEMQMMPFGFPPMPSFNMNRLFADYGNMAPGGNGNCHSFTSSSVMTMTSGPDGRPQVYQASSSMRTAPGGVKETKKTVCDSRTGTKKMAIGHHIGERAHILEREHNIHSGDQEERQEYINLDEEEADDFNKEWETGIQRNVRAIDSPGYNTHGSAGYGSTRHRDRPEHNHPALPAPPSSRLSSRPRWQPAPRRGIRSLSSSKPSGLTSTSRAAPSKSETASAASVAPTTTTASSPSGSRKRDHTPDSERSNKRHVKPNSDD